MLLKQLTEARTLNARIQTKYALFHTTRGKFYQSSYSAKQGFRLKGEFSGGISFYKTPERAEQEIKKLRERLLDKLGKETSSITSTIARKRIERFLKEIDDFKVVKIEASFL